MRKISTICRLPRIIYPAFIAGLSFTFWSFSALSQIAPPAEPSPQAPPPQSRSGSYRFEQRDRRELEEKIEKQKASEKLKAQVKQEKRETFLKSRLFAGFAEFNVSVARALVRDNRSDYKPDPSAHVSGYVRSFWGYGLTDPQLWYGFRIAPFGGYGTQNGQTARFAHTWIGPALGFGRFYTPDDRAGAETPVRLFMVSGGIAALSKLANEDESFYPAPKDFKPCAWCHDPPGLWAEVRWTALRGGVTGWGWVLGLQTGTNKILPYGGLALSGFY